MKKRICVAALIAALLALSACGDAAAGGKKAESLSLVVTEETIGELEEYPNLKDLDLSGSLCYEEIEAYKAEHPQVQVRYTVDIGGSQVDSTETALSLGALAWDEDTLRANAKYLTQVAVIETGDKTLSVQKIKALREIFPEAEINGTVAALDGSYALDTEEINLSAVNEERAEEAAELLSVLPGIRRVVFSGADGECGWGLENMALVASAAPEGTEYVCNFELFGLRVSSEDTEILYDREEIGDEGLETVRKALPLLSSCGRFVLKDCDIAYELLDQLRSDFPERNIVWCVHFSVQHLLTDDEMLWSTYVTDENADTLRYCTGLRYLDVGHTNTLTNFNFISYLSNLEVLILAKTGIADLSPLANCPKLEYLELISTPASDLSPLSGLTNLKHLNISNMKNMTDISPLYGLTGLERLRLVRDQVPEEQKETIQELLPNCDCMFEGADPTENGWRYDEQGNAVPRYALLREQFGYKHYNTPAEVNDWDEVFTYHYSVFDVFTRS